MKKILIVFGTRPEAIKMAPLIKKMGDYRDIFDIKVCVTSQHKQMLYQALDIFAIKPDFDLNIMKEGQDLYDITANVITGMKDVLNDFQPELVLVQGDTSTAFAAGLAAFYRKIAVGHVEAGLRTNDIYSPWPEEVNRQLISRIAQYHFAPTAVARDNLLKENVPAEKIIVTGNTVIDALLMVINRIRSDQDLERRLRAAIKETGYPLTDRKFILVTGHRRENFGRGFLNICMALKKIVSAYPDIDIVYPAHLNPNVQRPVLRELSGIPNIYIIKPLGYETFVYLMHRSYLILTDSGGIQEEAPSLGKPVLVMRDTTERPEAIRAGTAKLVGTDGNSISAAVSRLIDNNEEYRYMSNACNPYGDGQASQRIVNFLNSVW